MSKPQKERGLLLLQMAKSATDYKDPAALERFLAARPHALTPRAVAAVLLYCAELKNQRAELMASELDLEFELLKAKGKWPKREGGDS